MFRRLIKKLVVPVIDWFLYTFLKERHKKSLSNLLTTKQKQRIKSVLKPGKKQAQLRKVERLKYKLYQLGFIEQAISDLQEYVNQTEDGYLRRLAAMELALWYANQYTEPDAKKSLTFSKIAAKGVTDKDYLRRIAILQAESYTILGDVEEAKHVITHALASKTHADLHLAMANLETSPEAKINRINKALRHFNIPLLQVRENIKHPLYDRLEPMQSLEKMSEDVKVTVIIPVYNAGEAVRTAIDSIINQTWTNLEILVVDDCSTDNTKEIVNEYTKKDARIQLLSTTENSGAYVARNEALKVATGDFVTINDADDWSHPLKIATQVKHLIESKSLIGNFSQQARATNELHFYRRGKPGEYIFANMSSFMFRREKVMEKIGYWDSVRFAGDSEFVKRVKHVFGEKTVKELPTALLSFQRQSEDSLTGDSAFGFPGYFFGVRKEYREAHETYHANNPNQLKYSFPQQRPFPVPEPMWPKREEKQAGVRHFDVIMASEFRLPGGTNMSNIEEIKAQKQMGLKVGLVQMYRYDLNSAKEMNPNIRALIDGDQVQMIVYGEKVTCDVLILRHPPVLEDRQKYLPTIEAKTICIIANQTPKKEYSESGEVLYDITRVEARAKEYFGKSGTWYPIGPLIRETLEKEHADELVMIDFSEEDWINIINVAEWKRDKRPANHNIVIGRHSRDQYVKWPIDKQELLHVYPDTEPFEVHILGGAKMPKKRLGELPKNWKVYEFGEIHPKEFLKTVDVFVYYTHPDLVEAFGRVIFEAMAVGVPVIIPPKYKVLFNDAAIYAEPEEVTDKIQQLMGDEALYQKQVETAQTYVEEHFGYTKHEKRLGAFLHE